MRFNYIIPCDTGEDVGKILCELNIKNRKSQEVVDTTIEWNSNTGRKRYCLNVRNDFMIKIIALLVEPSK